MGSRKAKTLTAEIYVIFRGLKFEPDAETGQISHFRTGDRSYLKTEIRVPGKAQRGEKAEHTCSM